VRAMIRHLKLVSKQNYQHLIGRSGCSTDLTFRDDAFMRLVRAFYMILELAVSLGNCFLTS